jgi:hypothetical protein
MRVMTVVGVTAGIVLLATRPTGGIGSATTGSSSDPCVSIYTDLWIAKDALPGSLKLAD